MSDSIIASPTSRSRRSDRGVPLLTTRVKPVGRLSVAERDVLYSLLDAHFTGVSRTQFERDLAEKESVVLAINPVTDTIVGFSTLLRLQATVEGEPVTAFFSGDTIIDRRHWGQMGPSRIWFRHLVTAAAGVETGRAYWFLISSGYKTYRFLPTFFRDFYPTWRRPTPPWIKRVLDVLATQKFADRYDPDRGIIRLAAPTPLRSGVADLTEERLHNPDVAFFARMNPGHDRGDELACLAEIHPDNLSAAGRRLLGFKAGEALAWRSPAS